MISTAMVITSAGDIQKRDMAFDVEEHLAGFCQDLVEGNFDRNWRDVLVAITAHRKSPVASVAKAEQWLQPRSPGRYATAP